MFVFFILGEGDGCPGLFPFLTTSHNDQPNEPITTVHSWEKGASCLDSSNSRGNKQIKKPFSLIWFPKLNTFV